MPRSSTPAHVEQSASAHEVGTPLAPVYFVLVNGQLKPAGWLTTEQAAEHVRLSSDTLAKLRTKGTGPKFSAATADPRYSVARLNEWMDSSEYQSIAEMRAAKSEVGAA